MSLSAAIPNSSISRLHFGASHERLNDRRLIRAAHFSSLVEVTLPSKSSANEADMPNVRVIISLFKPIRINAG